MNKFLLIFFLIFSFYINSNNVDFDLQSDYSKKLKEKICSNIASFPQEIAGLIFQYSFVAEDIANLYVKVKINIKIPKNKGRPYKSYCPCYIHEYDLVVSINKDDTFKNLKKKIFDFCLEKEEKYLGDHCKECGAMFSVVYHPTILIDFDEIEIYLFDEIINEDEKIISFKKCLMYSPNYPLGNYFTINLIANAMCKSTNRDNKCIIA